MLSLLLAKRKMVTNMVDVKGRSGFRRYKMVVSLLMGVLAFAGIFWSVRLEYGSFNINFAFSLLLPMLVSLAWGWKYGLASVTFGLVFLYPFILGSYNGWASLVPALSYFIWIGLHGLGSMKRLSDKRLRYNLYFLQFIYIVLKFLLYLTLFSSLIELNPPFWNPMAYTKVDPDIILVFAIKGILVDSILLALGDALLLLPFVRKLFRLKVSKGAGYNTPVLAGMVAFGTGFTFIILLINNYIIGREDPLQWILQPGETTRFTFIMSILLFAIMAGIAIRFLQKNLESQISMEKRNRQYLKVIDQIKALNKELEDRVVERTNELKNALDENEQFSFAISHDLKAPVRAIDAYGSMLLEDSGEVLEPEGRKMLLSIRTICGNMIEQIENLLEYSVISKKALNKQLVETEAIVGELFEQIRIGSAPREISLVIEGSLPVILADRVLIKNLFLNLLSNAAKFSRPKQDPRIKVRCADRGPEYLFEIEDNGVGFDMKYSGKLFGMFQRMHSRDEFEGTGIGLAVVKKIVEKHGGGVWIESRPDEGTRVFFTIPKEVAHV